MITAKFNLEKWELCDELKKIRNELRLTQKEFGELFGIPQNNISMWENYKSAPPKYVITMIKKIIELLKQGEQMHIEDCLYCMELRERRENELKGCCLNCKYCKFPRMEYNKWNPFKCSRKGNKKINISVIKKETPNWCPLKQKKGNK